MAKIITIFIAVVLLFTSCRDIFEADLSNEQQTLIAPADSTLQTNLNVTFIWNAVEGASEYQLQVVTPDFTYPQAYVFDTLVSGQEVTLPLYAGEFEWRVRAKNYGSNTDFSEARKLFLEASNDLSSQTLLLNSPVDGYYSNQSSITFTWQKLDSADSYNFVLEDGITWGSGVELENIDATTNSYTATYSFVEGSYSWSVRGENTLPSSTPFATERILYIDQTDPATPIAILPTSTTAGLMADSTYLFDWTRPVDPGTVNAPLFDSVYIYADTNQLPAFKYYSAVEDIDIVLPSTPNTYYWKVATFDEAGNVSFYSNTNSFVVN